MSGSSHPIMADLRVVIIMGYHHLLCLLRRLAGGRNSAPSEARQGKAQPAPCPTKMGPPRRGAVLRRRLNSRLEEEGGDLLLRVCSGMLGPPPQGRVKCLPLAQRRRPFAVCPCPEAAAAAAAPLPFAGRRRRQQGLPVPLSLAGRCVLRPLPPRPRPRRGPDSSSSSSAAASFPRWTRPASGAGLS